MASPMTAMSKAIRRTMEDFGATENLRQLDDDVLRQFASIAGAYAADLGEEIKRREGVAALADLTREEAASGGPSTRYDPRPEEGRP